jgi:hypothetical protein
MAENLNIIGNWDVIVDTPFGESKALALIKAINPFITGTIDGERGSFDFDNGVVNENVLTFFASVDTPIKAKLSVDVAIEDNEFSGTLMIDEYMKVAIRGIKNVNL